MNFRVRDIPRSASAVTNLPTFINAKVQEKFPQFAEEYYFGFRPGTDNCCRCRIGGERARKPMEPETASTEPTSQSRSARERNWAPLVIASAVVLAILAVGLLLSGHRKQSQDSNALSATPAPYAANLLLTNLAMSESSNLAGGKVTYLDGHIANQGDRTVTEVEVQVTFRDFANKVAQSQTLPLTLIRMREPYIDTVMVSAAPLKPGAQQDFRLNFDAVSPDWAGALPEVKIVRVGLK